MVIELDWSGKFSPESPKYLMVKTHWFPVDFPLNQSNDIPNDGVFESV